MFENNNTKHMIIGTILLILIIGTNSTSSIFSYAYGYKDGYSKQLNKSSIEVKNIYEVKK